MSAGPPPPETRQAPSPPRARCMRSTAPAWAWRQPVSIASTVLRGGPAQFPPRGGSGELLGPLVAVLHAAGLGFALQPEGLGLEDAGPVDQQLVRAFARDV